MDIAQFMDVSERSIKTYCVKNHGPDDDTLFRKLYRFKRENVVLMANTFIKNCDTRGGGLDPIQKLMIVLRYFSDPGFQTGVGLDLGVHQTTVCKILQEVMPQIVSKANKYIVFPTTNQQILESKVNWFTHFKMPCTIGAIDCTLIKIPKPKIFGDEFICRKGFPSLNVQMTCDYNGVITSVNASWPGSVHDSRIFKNSEICAVMQKPVHSQSILLGDSGYGITPFLLTPYLQCENAMALNYNKLHCKARVIIEQTFGQLKRRFPILHYGIRLKLQSAPQVIICCCVLHNIAKKLNDIEDFDDFPPSSVGENADNSNNTSSNVYYGNPVMRQKGIEKRNEIAQVIF